MKTVKSTFRFSGGVHPDSRKDATASRPVVALPLPKTLAVSMSQHLGAPATCLVKAGEHVACGQLIGVRTGCISVPVHAPAAGTVRDVAQRPGPSGALSTTVILETDADQTAAPPVLLQTLDWRTASLDDLRARVDEAGICGLGGAGFPTVVKLSPPPGRRCEYLVVNGAECEPYLTADDRLMQEQATKIRTGVEIVRRLLGGPAVRIAVEANKAAAIAALERAFADIDGDVEIVVLPVLYPQGSEKHQIYATVGRIVPEPPALPIDVGCVVENVATVAAIADAVTAGIPLTHRIMTVTGDAVADPKNVLAPIGTCFQDLVDFCGGTCLPPRKIIAGGPMMGHAVASTDVATTKTSSGLLLLSAARVFQFAANPCIGCGRCVRVCPMRLNPAEISRAVESDDIADAERRGAMNCIECGACAYSCPAYRSLTQHCRRAKISIRARIAAEKKKAQDAAQRK